MPAKPVEARFSPDGKRIVTAGFDRTACIWDAVTYVRLATLSGHPSRVRHAAFSSDGSLVATTDEDGSTRVWEANSGRLLATHRQPTADGVNGVTEVAFAPRDNAIFTRNSQSVQLWEIATGRVLALLEDASERLTDGALSLERRPAGYGRPRKQSGTLRRQSRAHGFAGVAQVAAEVRGGASVATLFPCASEYAGDLPQDIQSIVIGQYDRESPTLRRAPAQARTAFAQLPTT